MAGSYDILDRDSLNDRLATLEQSINGLEDANFATYALIDKNKFSPNIYTQDQVSATHKIASTRKTSMVALDHNGNYYPPQQIGGTTNNIKIDRTKGILAFNIGSSESAHINTSGWHNGVSSDTDGCTKIELSFDKINSYWTISIDSAPVAYIDPLNDAGIFISSLPGGTRKESLGASIDFSTSSRIDFRYDGNIIGYIDLFGTHEGQP